MPNYGPITVDNGADVPVSLTFNQGGLDGTWLTWVDRVDGRPDLSNKIKARLRAPNRPNQPYRVDVSAVLIETFTNADGELEMSEMDRFDGTYTLSAKSETAARKNLRAVVSNLGLNSQVASIIDDLVVPY